MPDRFVPQVILYATDLGLCKTECTNITKNVNTGTRIARMARIVPVRLPPLASIIMKLTIPRITATNPKGRKKMVKMANRNAVIASLLILTSTPSAGEAGSNVELQELHN